MIKANLDEVNFEGHLDDIAAEFCTVSNGFKDLCIKELGEEKGNLFFEKMYKIANMDKEELKKEVQIARYNMFLKLLGIGD